MINLIIFDLDGVLCTTKDLHFHALNKALEFFGHDPILYENHVAYYDGKPTKVKLEMYGIDDDLIRSVINTKKQEYTANMLEESITRSQKLIDICTNLKEHGYKLAVASNSIRYTILVVLFKLGVLKYIDCVVSNEDVKHPKPHSEMYLKCMIDTGTNPRDTLILEDSYVGREGVHNSGANLCPVKAPVDVTIEYIQRSIHKYNEVKNKWKDPKMNVLIPMAGRGTRFANAGYSFPKPLIDVLGKPMIQQVVENLNIDAHYIFIVQDEHHIKYNIDLLLELIAPSACKIIHIKDVTEGAACTTLLAKEFINNDEPLLIANSDQIVEWDSSDFIYAMQGDNVDGGILTFKNTHPKWSFAKVEDNLITEVAEKKPISDNATVGIYYWKHGKDYVRCAESMIKKNIRFNNEFYVCPVYNEAIQEGMKIKPYEIRASHMHGLGTPEDLQKFIADNHEGYNAAF